MRRIILISLVGLGALAVTAPRRSVADALPHRPHRRMPSCPRMAVRTRRAAACRDPPRASERPDPDMRRHRRSVNRHQPTRIGPGARCRARKLTGGGLLPVGGRDRTYHVASDRTRARARDGFPGTGAAHHPAPAPRPRHTATNCRTEGRTPGSPSNVPMRIPIDSGWLGFDPNIAVSAVRRRTISRPAHRPASTFEAAPGRR